jgi:hypothetical protein
MENENQLNEIQVPCGKIFTKNQIWVGTTLGGPMVGGYLISRNFKQFDDNV